MQNQILKIIFLEDKAYLCPMKALSLSDVEMLSVVNSFPAPAYCRVKVVKYQEASKRLRVSVLSLSVGETDFSMEQKALAYQLQEVEEVRTTNGYNTTEVFKAVQVKKIVPTKEVPRPVALPKVEKPRPKPKPKPPPPPKKPVRRVIQESFSLAFKDFYFVDGGVAFHRRFLDSRKSQEAVIYNDSIQANFNAIKAYFVNILGIKRITVFATIQTTDNLIDAVEVKSPDVDKIGAGLIETVKDSYVEGLIKPKKRAKNRSKKQLFTMQEFFQNASDNQFQAAAFYEDDKVFFEDLLEKSNTKHGQHLRYLAKRHEHRVMKLRFLDAPLSFVFLMEGQKRYYIVWETLDTTEATYIWHVHKDKSALKRLFLRVETIISSIKVDGKLGYIAVKEEAFVRVFHDYSEEGFLRWKEEILRVVV